MNTLRAITVLLLLSVVGLRSASGLPASIGDLDADGQPTVLDLVALINHLNGVRPLTLPLRFADLDQNQVVNDADLERLEEAILGMSSLPSASLTPVVDPITGATGQGSIVLTGRVYPGTTVRIEGGATIVTGVADANGNFTIDVPLGQNRLNRLFVSGTDEQGQPSAPIPIDILHDAQPPSLFIDMPVDGAELTTSNIVVAGRIGDMLSGFMGLAVTVNGLPGNTAVGIGPNGTFERGEVPLALGTNVITVIASDVLGNTTTRQVTVTRIEPVGPRMVAISGDAQITNIHRRLANPIVVQVTYPDGTPFANKVVTFEVMRSDGRLVTDPASTNSGGLTAQALTDADGKAAAYWTLGGDAGCGNNRISVTSRDISGSVFFCASAAPAPAAQINVGTGNNQRVEAGGPAMEPLRAWVSDGCNGVAGIPVTFTVIQGGGKVNGQSSVTIPTSLTGHAQVNATLGPDEGNNAIEATFPGNPGRPATFVLYGVRRDPAQSTTMRGLVLDNSSQPIGGAYCFIKVGGSTVATTYSDVNGQFHMTNVPAGPAHLYVDGLPATLLGGRSIPRGSYPALHYTLTIIPNAENSLPTPVLLPKLNPNNAHVYYGTNDITLTCEGMEGLKMFVKAGSMRKPDGSLVSPANPAVIALNQVHHDEVPMPIPDGAAPPFAWTLQPGGATFDPPIKIEYPNMSALPPGAIAYFLSFNHDTERFEIVASGHVIKDGSCIVTDPGAGLSLAGWGCNCPPYAVTADCEKCKTSCENRGSLTGGVATANITDGCVGETIQFSVSGVTDSGGTRKKICEKAGTSIEQIPAGAVTYKWSIKRSGIQVTSGAGQSASVVANQRGVYTCEFTASASRDCAPPTRTVRSPGVTIDPCCVEITAPRVGDSDLRISLVPAMPQVTCRARVPDYEGGTITFSWRFKVTYDQCKGFSQKEYMGTSTASGSAETEWQVPFGAEVYGGFVDIKVTASASDLPACSDEISPYKILGTQPAASDVAALLASPWYAVGIGRQESVLRQFNAQGFPLPNGNCDGGYGIMQITSCPHAPNAADLWNWRANVADGLNCIGIKRNEALTKWQGDFARYQAWTNMTGIEPPIPANITYNNVTFSFDPAPGEHPFWEAAAIKRYNSGGNRPFIDWNETTHEWVINVLNNFGDNYVQLVCNRLQGQNSPQLVESALVAPLVSSIPFEETLDDSWTVSINGQSVRVNADGSFLIPNIASPDQFGIGGPGSSPDFLSDDFVRLLGMKTADGITRYVASAPFQIRQGQTFILNDSDLAFGDIPPRTPESITIIPDAFTLAATGATTQVRVTARHSDGTSIDVTPRSRYTTYRTSNPGIATAGPNGIITAVGKGKALITAVNEGVASVTQIDVSLGELTTVRGFLRDENGQPLAGVEVRIAGGAQSAVTGADGSFTITDVPTDFGAISVITDPRTSDGTLLLARAIGLEPVPGGFTDAGIISFQPLRALNAPFEGGGGHSVALKADRTLRTWGYNLFGQLGDNTTAPKSAPIQIGTASDWAMVAAGFIHTLAIKTNGTLWAWGDNVFGQSGDGTEVDRRSPVQVGSGSDWVAVAAGEYHSLGLKRDGSLWAWGANFIGQLGDGSDVDQSAPVRIGSDNDWLSIAAGDRHSLAIKRDGSLWAWGANAEGQLGDSTGFDQFEPVPVDAEAGWIAVAAGESHSVGLMADGSLWAWGDNNFGQLGDGSFSDQYWPSPVNDTYDWIGVAAGLHHSVGLKADGSIWAWGRNNSGQLGDGSGVQQDMPVQVGVEHDWTSIAVGDHHSLGLKKNGTLWSWGRNSSGQLGDGTSINKAVPVQVLSPGTWKQAE